MDDHPPALFAAVHVLTAAHDLFVTKGYGRTTIADVAAEPGVAPETVYSARLTAFAVFNTAAMRRTARLHLAVRGAAASDPAAVAMLAEIDRQRLESMGGHAREAAATGQLAVAEEECRDVLFATTDGTLWHQLVEGLGWSDERYAAWLGRLWTASFVLPLS
ncbi:TetR family transcriptional regulator [Amycolatopsis sp. NPDC098790]|uniref:TetR family transcriptional regulator n=1 Tax=Amycolatopsis sp. NPDC098790 TaxID=3363939 RepID=UPI00382B50DE